jgi:hypothetical protein
MRGAEGMMSRLGTRHVIRCGALLLGLAAARPAQALTINATYGASVTATQQTVINSAIAFYQSTFVDPITVNITFNADVACGLGCSTSLVYKLPYTLYRPALGTDGTSADDTTALASVPTGASNPVTGSTTINVKSADGRAVGLATTAVFDCATGGVGGTQDGCIRFNPTLITTTPPQPGLYSLTAVIEHEIDEVLGLGSDVGGSGFFADPAAEDLFRYSAAGVRSYVATGSCPGPVAYFSIDGGATNLAGFNNCNNGGDYGDWVIGGPVRVQDAFGTPNTSPFLTSGSVEVRALDVIGYTLAPQVTPVPEPVSLVLLGSGLAGIVAARRRRQNKA